MFIGVDGGTNAQCAGEMYKVGMHACVLGLEEGSNVVHLTAGAI